MSKEYIFFLYLLIAIDFVAQAQIGDRTRPYSLSDTFKNSPIRKMNDVNHLVVSNFDNNDLLFMDSLLQIENGFAYTFATSIKLNIEIQDYMSWDTLEGNLVMGRIQLQSPTAYSSFLIFDDFYLCDNTKLYAYNEDGTQIIGALTKNNNKPYGRFSLGPIIGEIVTLEIIKPIELVPQSRMHMEAFIHSYKDVFNYSVNRGIECLIDVKCSEGELWCDQINSIVLIVRLNANTPSAICSGSLITNERRDLRPYLLTAHHCTNGKNVEDWIFIFNYQAEECDGLVWNYWSWMAGNIIFHHSVSGATLIASNEDSDFSLLELSSSPPSYYNAYYSGWNRKNERPEDGAIIGHPSGGAKKNTLCEGKAVRKIFIPEPDPYKVKSWEVKFSAGTVTYGSSGSPYYNSDGLIVGQACGSNNNVGEECTNSFRLFLGRFDISWQDGSSVSKRLREWLNPNYNYTHYSAMSGDEQCKTSYYFTNANDLHTSSNVTGIMPYQEPWPGDRTFNGEYSASGTIKAENNVSVLSGTSVKFYANEIKLLPDFTANEGCYFLASSRPCIKVCNTKVDVEKFVEIDSLTNNENLLYYSNNNEVNIEESSINTNNQITLYPNPNTGTFQLETNFPLSEIGNFKVINLMGATVYETQSLTSSTIQLQTAATGQFFVVAILKDGRVLTQKMMIQR